MQRLIRLISESVEIVLRIWIWEIEFNGFTGIASIFTKFLVRVPSHILVDQISFILIMLKVLVLFCGLIGLDRKWSIHSSSMLFISSPVSLLTPCWCWEMLLITPRLFWFPICMSCGPWQVEVPKVVRISIRWSELVPLRFRVCWPSFRLRIWFWFRRFGRNRWIRWFWW